MSNLKESVQYQRQVLSAMIGGAMEQLGRRCYTEMAHPATLERLLAEALPQLQFCKHLYVLDHHGTQITANITQQGLDESQRGRNRMERPYMQGVGADCLFHLSDAYISRNSRRPSLTAMQVIGGEEGTVGGYLGADYDLRELPHTGKLYQEPDNWRQVKGDPAIRSGLFLQQRAESVMDRRLDVVLPLMGELMTMHGIYHGKLHFSSSRATIWMVDDPFVYRILHIDELTDPAICLAYNRHPYIERAITPKEMIAPIFEMFRQLRFADENIYLRAGSLNVVNGMVGLNFSCDGSHYMRYDEFLQKSISFWFGTSGRLTAH